VVSCQVKPFLQGLQERQPDRRTSLPTIPYPSDLSEREWQRLSPLLPSAKPGGRPRTVQLRLILNGSFSLLRSGCQWRLLPRDYGPWSTV
jgi:putative transposase